MKLHLLPLLFVVLLSTSCQKESFYTSNDVVLRFSTDTILFDTIFSEIGTVTKRLLVHNPKSEAIIISSIRLASENSPYLLNISGIPKEAHNIEIAGGDSMYIFVQVLAPQNNTSEPLFKKDSILFETNGSQQNVKLISYSQDVILFRNDTISSQTWDKGKPYLIYGNLYVDSLATLTIHSGVNVYLHKNANIIVKGNIIALGSFYEPIIFKQDRLDDDYKDIPGYWGSIIIIPGYGQQKFDWVKIENGTGGLQMFNFYKQNNSLIELSNTIIQNMSFTCFISYRAQVTATNCLLANAKYYPCYLDGGGTFQFTHTTIANYYSPYDSRKNNFASLYVSNYLLDTAKNYEYLDISNSFFRNSIIYGSFENELILDFNSNATSDIIFDHCLIKKSSTTELSSKFNSPIWNKDPKFIDPEYLNFELDTLSSAKNAGASEWGSLVPYDLKNENRLIDENPDLGAYERIENKK